MAREKRSRPSQVGRRRLLQGAAQGSALVATAAVLGCRGERGPTVAPTAAEPKRGGIIIHGARANHYAHGSGGFDPHTGVTALSKPIGLFYQNLVGYDEQTSEVKPELAQAWEQPSQTEYVFRLQPGVRWHNRPPINGRELTAADVLFSLERARTPNPRFVHRTFLDSVIRMEAVDRATVRMTTKGADAALLSKVSATPLKVLAPEVIEQFEGRLASGETVVGTGPFLLKSAEQGVGSEAVRNPDYWKPGRPYLDGVRIPYFADDEVAWAAFLAGRIDISPIPGEEVKRYIARQGPGYTPQWGRRDSNHGVPEPNTRLKPFDDRRVTKALRLLLDHEEILRAFNEPFSGQGRYGCIFPSLLDDWDLTQEEYSRHLEWKQPKDDAIREAMALLRAAGFTPATPLRFEVLGNDNIRTLVELVQAQWKRFSQGAVDAILDVQPSATVNRRRAQTEFTFLLHVQVGAAIDPGIWLDLFIRTGGSQNYMGWSDPKGDGMIEQQAQMLDQGQRKALVREIMLYLIDNCPYSIANKNYGLSGVKPHIRGLTPEGSGLIQGHQYERVWLES